MRSPWRPLTLGVVLALGAALAADVANLRPRRAIQESARGSSMWRSPSSVPARRHKV